MLVHLHKTSRAGKALTGGIVMQTKFMGELVVSGTGCAFKFYERPETFNGSPTDYVVAETVAYIRARMNDVASTNTVILDVFPHNDPTSDTVRHWAHYDEIVKVYPAEPPINTIDRDRSWLILNLSGTKIERLLVNQYYLDFVQINVTGSTSSTTTSTSTTSTSSTSTTSTSTTSTSSTSTTTTGP